MLTWKISAKGQLVAANLSCSLISDNTATPRRCWRHLTCLRQHNNGGCRGGTSSGQLVRLMPDEHYMRDLFDCQAVVSISCLIFECKEARDVNPTDAGLKTVWYRYCSAASQLMIISRFGSDELIAQVFGRTRKKQTAFEEDSSNYLFFLHFLSRVDKFKGYAC